jgi:hypothetical protein
MAEDDHLARLHKEVADLEERLKRFELDELQVSERIERGPWVDITQRYVEEKKRTLGLFVFECRLRERQSCGNGLDLAAADGPWMEGYWAHVHSAAPM